MQAYKVKGKIDDSGHLIITEPIAMAPGDVEIIVLQPAPTEGMVANSDSVSNSGKQVTCEIPSLKQWLEQTPSVPPGFDPDQAKWEYLKEKHHL